MGCQSTCTGYELLNNLDFDTDGNGSTYIGTGTSAMGDSGDDYYNGGSGWVPIGRFDATFKGNGYIISNLFIKRTTTSPVGLFGTLDGNDRVESVGVKNAYVYGRNFTGILVGTNHGTVAASWSTGSVLGDVAVGGLVGQNLKRRLLSPEHNNSQLLPRGGACDSQLWNRRLRGRFGWVGPRQPWPPRPRHRLLLNGRGHVNGRRPHRRLDRSIRHHLHHRLLLGHANKRQDERRRRHGPDDHHSKGKTDYTGIYANWNVDVDGVTGNDNPWDFGTSSQYPVLKYGGHSLAAQGRTVTDYDTDNDRLIDITTLAQLNAIRWDLNGDGAIDSSARPAIRPPTTPPFPTVTSVAPGWVARPYLHRLRVAQQPQL